ncbi:MAG: hypothetical protein ACT4OJ_03025 [Bacteroidota bacterium]
MKRIFTGSILILLIHLTACGQTKDKPFTESLIQDGFTFSATGRNTYFILEPGYQLTLEGVDGKDSMRLVITVLNETKKIGTADTRIVEENESVNGKIVEISKNYFAFCKENSSIYYFGEDVDIYKNGKIASHDGAWAATGNNKPGVIMPGLILLGARYYQEIAPGVAMDRAEIISTSEQVNTPSGNFSNCLKTEETTPLEPPNKEYKFYAPGVGLIRDGDLVLVKYGFIK